MSRKERVMQLILEGGDTKSVTDFFTYINSRELTDRQCVIIGFLSFYDTGSVTNTTAILAQRIDVPRRPIACDLNALGQKGYCSAHRTRQRRLVEAIEKSNPSICQKGC